MIEAYDWSVQKNIENPYAKSKAVGRFRWQYFEEINKNCLGCTVR